MIDKPRSYNDTNVDCSTSDGGIHEIPYGGAILSPGDIQEYAESIVDRTCENPEAARTIYNAVNAQLSGKKISNQTADWYALEQLMSCMTVVGDQSLVDGAIVENFSRKHLTCPKNFTSGIPLGPVRKRPIGTHRKAKPRRHRR